ncbi:LINE-1 retrotransposable element ORF2 protein [Bienertia sinuspersici]
MARNSKKKGGSVKKPSRATSKANKTKESKESVDVHDGVDDQCVNPSDEEEEIRTPKSTLIRAQQKNPENIPMQNHEADIACITADDIQPEVDYWKTSIVGFVIGANPPGNVMDGFFRRIWKEHGVDKVITIDRGTFLIRFNTLEQRDRVLAMGRVFFDYKPVILKPWHIDMDLTKEDIQRIPIWVKLNLHFKYWGQNCLARIMKPVGTLIKVDSMTANRDRLQDARCMIEVKVDQVFPEEVKFRNEKNDIIDVGIKYEWKPESCKKCKKLGHDETQCYIKEKTSKEKKIWQKKGLVQQGTVIPSKEPNRAKLNRCDGTEGTDPTIINQAQVGQDEDRMTPYQREEVQVTDDRVWSKVDRVMANEKWLELFQDANAVFLTEGCSDHCPALLRMNFEVGKGRKPFKYFQMWQQAPNYSQRIQQAWEGEVKGTAMFQVTQKLKRVKTSLKELNKKGFNNLQAEETRTYQEMVEIQETLHREPLNTDLMQKEKDAVCNYNQAHKNCIRKRTLQNNVYAIRDRDGSMKDSPEGIQAAFVDYYKELLGKAMTGRAHVHLEIIMKGPVLQEDQKSKLVQPFTKEEVRKAIFSIPGNKSLGPDGFGTQFYKHNWDLIGEEVTTAILDFFESGKLSYLWSGQWSSNRSGYVSWESICRPKKEGGLGFKNLQQWNIANMGRYVWAIENKQDSLWLKWVNSVYIKGQEWWSYKPPIDASWYWNRICDTKEKLRSSYNQSELREMKKYKVSRVYSGLKAHTTPHPWSENVWSRFNIPKYRFCAWLAIQNRLPTAERLVKRGSQVDIICPLCSTEEENSQHLFFGWSYSKGILDELKQWMRLTTKLTHLQYLFKWIRRKGRSMELQKAVWHSAITAVVFLVWQIRNEVRHGKGKRDRKWVVEQIKYQVRTKISMEERSRMNEVQLLWLDSL